MLNQFIVKGRTTFLKSKDESTSVYSNQYILTNYDRIVLTLTPIPSLLSL